MPDDCREPPVTPPTFTYILLIHTIDNISLTDNTARAQWLARKTTIRGLDRLRLDRTMEHTVDETLENPSPDDEVLELERELCRLPEVSAARVVTDDIGRATEVHILANGAKHAKQVVRDVQSVALASFGIELDRRIVSVVQLNGDGHDRVALGAPVELHRAVLVDVVSEITGLRSLMRVTLARGNDEAVGFAEGSIATSARHRLVAAATIDALRQLQKVAECLDVDSAQIVRVGIHDVAIVTIVFVIPPAEQLVSGSAIVRDHAEPSAVVRAVLDATNRRLTGI